MQGLESLKSLGDLPVVKNQRRFNYDFWSILADFSENWALKTQKVHKEDLKKRFQNLPNHHRQYVRELLTHFLS